MYTPVFGSLVLSHGSGASFPMDILNYREDTNTMRTAILFLVSFVIDLLLVGAYFVLAGGTVPSDIIIWAL